MSNPQATRDPRLCAQNFLPTTHVAGTASGMSGTGDGTSKNRRPLSDIEQRGLGNKSTSGMGTNAGMGTIDNHQGIGEGTHTGHQHDPGTGPSMAPMANGSTEGNRREHNSKATIRDAPTCFSPASAFIPGARADLQQAAGVTRTGYVDATGPGSNQNSAGKIERDTRQGSSTTGKTKSDGGKDAMPRERPTIKDKIIGRTEKITGKLIANAEMVDRGEERMAGTYEAAKKV